MENISKPTLPTKSMTIISTELDRMVRTADIDIVAHFDIPARTGIPIFGYEPLRYEEKIRSVLKTCIERGLALDVNVSGLRKPARNIMPDPLILKWYTEMGGQRLTLGSDAHRLPEVSLHLEKGTRSHPGSRELTSITQFRATGRRYPLPLE